jgi:hypothetical protein
MTFCRCYDGLKVWLLACTLISNSVYATITPFLPIEIENKGVSTVWVVPIFVIYSVVHYEFDVVGRDLRRGAMQRAKCCCDPHGVVEENFKKRDS